MKFAGLAAVFVLLLSLLTMSVRPLLPIDETRYVAVAWEAHERGDLLVSHLNGDTYAHKPPLLFWLINLIWQFTGVSEFAARLPGPLAAAVSVLLTRRTARMLASERLVVADSAALIHSGCLLWLFFCPLTMFDTLLTLSAELAVQGVLLAGLGIQWRGWGLAGAALGAGVLCKGPVVLLWVLPLAFAAPWWVASPVRGGWKVWYASLAGAVLLAATIALAWALPSARAGGAEYGQELLFGQTAGRMVNSFAHRQPMWWYLPLLPLCLMPWLLWPAVWRGCLAAVVDRGCWSMALRVSLLRAAGGFVLLSLTSGKQVYYLLPMIPACALLLADLLQQSGIRRGRGELLPVALGTMFLGAVPLLVNHVSAAEGTGLPGLVSDGSAVLLICCGVVLLVPEFSSVAAAVAGISGAAAVFVAILVAALQSTLWAGFDVGPLARAAAESGVPAGWLGGYHGQLNFAGRIRRVEELGDAESVSGWLSAHGEVVLAVRLPRGEPMTAELADELWLLDRQHPDAATGRRLAEKLREAGVIPAVGVASRLEFVQRLRTGLRESLFVLVRFTGVSGELGAG